jgi:hypothetical protein
MKNLAAFDLVILIYVGIITAVIVALRPEGTLVYLGYHAAAVGLIAMIVYAFEHHGGKLWTFCRYWYVPLVAGAAFREMHYLIPQVHPFEDHRWDGVLNGLDRRWFGDVDAFFLRCPPLVMDALHVCYWFYFVSILIPGGVLFARKDWDGLKEYLTVILTGLLLSYLGYFVLPAIGPHHFFHPRPPQLDGWVVGKPLHEAMLAVEWKMPDAFPSGHALLSMIVIVMTWRLHRPTFRALVAPALGCVMATMVLRYHYVVDVVASVILLPPVLWAGIRFHRSWTRKSSPAGNPEHGT